MLISVIVPVYNKEDYLNNCIRSVANQDYENLEIIIINDGSQDNSDNIIREWTIKENRIKYFSQKNKGVAYTRNKGISIARGEYLFFLDADDSLESEAISKLVLSAQQTEADIIIGNHTRKKGNMTTKNSSFNNELLKESDLSLIDNYLNMFLINARPLATVWNKLYKLDFIKKIEVKFEDDIIAEDRLFNLKCYVSDPTINLVNEYTFFYNIIENSRSRSFDDTFYYESISLLESFYKFLESKAKLDNYYELFQLIVMYDVNKILSHTFNYSEQKKLTMKSTITKLRENKLIYETIYKVIQEKKFKGIKKGRTFNRIRLKNYLLVVVPIALIPYKYIGYITRSLRLGTNNVN